MDAGWENVQLQQSNILIFSVFIATPHDQHYAVGVSGNLFNHSLHLQPKQSDAPSAVV